MVNDLIIRSIALDSVESAITGFHYRQNLVAVDLAAVGGDDDDNNHIIMEKKDKPPSARSLNSSSISLSDRQMETLFAICDTFLPSVDNISPEKKHLSSSSSLFSFYRTSASMTETPQHIGRLIGSEMMKHPKMILVKLTLWLLSTWLGTFILCGKASLSVHTPFIRRFSEIPLAGREKILLSWSVSFFSPLRMLFVALKFLTLLVFFSKVDEKQENKSWNAIGYCGPDPEFKTQRIEQLGLQERESEEKKIEDESNKEQIFGPLYCGIVNLKQPLKVVAETLKRSGFRAYTTSTDLLRQNKVNSSNSAVCSPSLTIKCDAVIVGSGGGGGVVAGVLAKAGYKVIVLEKGSYYARSRLSLLEGPSMEKMYLGHGLLASDDMRVLILAGSTVGGGSTINWSASIKTPPHVLKEWSMVNNIELFESKLYREAMDVVCKKMGVQSQVKNESLNNMVLRKGCQELDYPVTDIPRNAQSDHYCGWCCFGCKDGKKKGTSETWLVDMVKSGNGVILPECEAIRVLHKRKRGRERSKATGVAFEFEHQGVKQVCVVESKITVSACGAMCTPSFLKRSGLRNPNIGKNLHLHPVVMGWGYFPIESGVDSWPEEQKKSFEGGIMTAMSTINGDFEGSGYGVIIQTPSLHPGMYSALIPWTSGVDIRNRMSKFSRTAHVFALARDKGSGKLSSPHSVNYQIDNEDEQNLQNSLEKVLRILAAAGAEEIGTHHREGMTLKVNQASSKEFERFLKTESSRSLKNHSSPICSAHQMGSCRMGVDCKDSVVNPMGETWEVEDLYIADSSVFPTALGVNPMVTIQAIAYCTAQSILHVLKRKKHK